jgi:hypothetical protein
LQLFLILIYREKELFDFFIYTVLFFVL